MSRAKRAITLLTIPFLMFAGISTAGAVPPRFTATESSALVEYARACLLARLDGIALPPPPPCATRQQQACFITFFQGRRVVACFGGFIPRRASLAEEIADNVRLALKNDPRSRGLSRETAQATGVQITFPLDQPERVADYRAIDPLREGMFVEGNDAGVAFVPGEARTASWAFRQALARLGESDPSSVRVSRFMAMAISTRGIDR
jgi:hypothetical protein